MYRSSYPVILLQAETLVQPRHFYAAVALFSGLILVLIITMLFIMLIKKKAIIQQKQLQLQFKDWLVGVILEETDEHHQGFEVPESIQGLLRLSFVSQELLQELKRLRNSLSGQPGENLEKLYRQLGLSELSARNLRSSRWYSKAKGIQELAVMNQVEFAEGIFPLTNHRHPVVRMEAQVALVFLKQYEGLGFFENLVYLLTDYHQVKLLQLLASQPIPSEKVISRWLRSSNASVVQFTLKLIGEQHAGNFQDEVIDCLCHRSRRR